MKKQGFRHHRKPHDKKESHHEDKEEIIKIYKGDFQDLYIRGLKLPKTLLDDLQKWYKLQSLRGYLYKELNEWLFEQKNDRLMITAAKSHKILDNLLLENIPYVYIEIYLNILSRNKKIIEKVIDFKGGQQLFKIIPTELLIDYLSLYEIQLTHLQKLKIIDELLQNKRTLNDNVRRLPKLLEQKDLYVKMLIHKLHKMRRTDLAVKVLKNSRLPRQQFADIQLEQIENSARSMHKWQKDFCWQRLQEVYGIYPSAIAVSIRTIFKFKDTKLVQGIASLVHRIPEVLKHLPQNITKRLKEVKDIVPNKLQNNNFGPSDPVLYFSFKQFGIQEADVILVDKDNLEASIECIFSSKRIGIDTESTVARTALSTEEQLLSIIQIANQSKVFIFDSRMLKKMKYSNPTVNAFFSNKEAEAIGHTLGSDLNHTITSLFGYTGPILCKTIDIQPFFQKVYPKFKSGLKAISKQILGKEICKEYTLTNWDRRPLFRNQIHYAAMDAFVVLKIWDILKLKQITKKTQEQIKQQSKQNEQKREKSQEHPQEHRYERQQQQTYDQR